MKYIISLIIVFSFYSCSIKKGIQNNASSNTNATELSVQFLNALKNGKATDKIKEKLNKYSVESLAQELDTDPKRFAFWTNIYNAYIQDILKANPELYNDRGSFFRKPRINFLGRTFTFGEIEHGILRRSQNEYGLGYVRKWFPPSWERKLRVHNRDFRLHFALNCGAKDCPPVAIYDANRINDQLNKGSKKYLKSSSIYETDTKKIKVTSLFNWFRGDFGGKSGTKDILKEYDIVPSNINPKLKYKDYDWTLYLDNYIEL